ncbi:GNAT superfamily N-acetyltransferase [Alkalibacillus filiformis]|uniref:GNAT superfamily N-acetyltransferase n=1 Tax=Alkalibacillus filiformis TaxID=200990 RepID=A0ABU0DUC4_9BACI|nr:GNAT family N-acetyltransferase [Alkalibacillus filiformis]MDQ0352050.1 GNAT superfamily N-acetyltransferase [Alkalibacillus filiformis]
MNTILIRDARREEIPLIRQQRVEAYEPYSQVLTDEHWQALKGTLSSENDTKEGVDLIVAELGDEIVGSVVLFPAETDAYEWIDALQYPELRMLAVIPKGRGHGIGKALVQECIKRTKQRGYSKMGLHTGEFMKSAIQLYEQSGFKRVPEHDFQPADDGVNVRAYVLDL